MQNKHLVLIYNPLYDEIKEYCDFNGIKVTPFVNELLNKQFLIEKYGESPFENINETIDKKIPENKETENVMKKEDNEKLKVFSHPGYINENIVYDDSNKFKEQEEKEETVIQKPKKRKLK